MNLLNLQFTLSELWLPCHRMLVMLLHSKVFWFTGWMEWIYEQIFGFLLPQLVTCCNSYRIGQCWGLIVIKSNEEEEEEDIYLGTWFGFHNTLLAMWVSSVIQRTIDPKLELHLSMFARLPSFKDHHLIFSLGVHSINTCILYTHQYSYKLCFFID